MEVDLTEEQLSQLLADWNLLLQDIFALSHEDVESLLEKHVNSTDSDSLDDKQQCLISWGLIRTGVGIINTSSAFIALENLKSISKSIKRFQDFKEAIHNTEESMDYCSSRANRLWFSVNEISSKVRSSKELRDGTTETFIHVPTNDDTSLSDLAHFIHVGEKIRRNDNFRSSNMGKFENLLVDFDAGLIELQSDTNAKVKYCSNTTFVALAAPSLEGKTQSAFVLKRVHPLYFPLSEAYGRTGNYVPQPIYGNFTDFVATLRDCALADWKQLSYAVPSAQEFLGSKKLTPLWTAGFLKSLICTFKQHLESNPRALDSSSWMSIFSERREFTFSQCTVEELKLIDGVKQFCLFLDEFVADPWAVMIRNLSRAVGLRCVVSNTNTKITSIVGKYSVSGTGGEMVWAFVVCRLNGASKTILNKMFGFEDSIRKIALYLCPDLTTDSSEDSICQRLKSSNEPVLKFLGSLDHAQIEAMRPGIAVFVAQALQVIADTKLGSINQGLLIDEVVDQMRVLLLQRKAKMKSETGAILGQIGLLLAQCYFPLSTGTAEKSTVADIAKTFNHRSHLEHHLYYLSNPTEAGKWAFLTFTAADLNGKTIIKYLTTDNSTALEWIVEYTHFRSDELMGILVCLSITYVNTVSRVLSDASLHLTASADSNADAENENAQSRHGNALEVTAAACLTKATHRAPHDRFSLAGVNGQDFIKNLITHYNSTDGFSTIQPLVVKYPSKNVFDLEAFMSACRFPCIYGWNHELPLLESWNFPKDQLALLLNQPKPKHGFFVRNFVREANKSKVDGRLEAFIGGEFKQVVVECKNHRQAITAPKLKDILAKCLRTPGAGLSLVFGTHFSRKSVSSAPVTSTKLEIDLADRELDAYIEEEKAEAKRARIETFQKEEEEMGKETVTETGDVTTVNMTKKKGEDDETLHFLQYCSKHNINVYRVFPSVPSTNESLEAVTYEILPFEPNFVIHEEPKLNCILLEEYYINSKKNRISYYRGENN